MIIGTLPAMIVGLLLNDWIEAKMSNAYVVAFMLILYGILFIVIENINAKREPRVTKLSPVVCSDSSSDQSLPDDGDDPWNIPVRSNDRRCFGTGEYPWVAAEFTFFLAIPVMFGASALKLFKFGLAFTPMQVFLLLLGMLVSFGVSIIAIKFLMKYIRNNDFKVFGYYRIVLGIIVFLYFGISALL